MEREQQLLGNPDDALSVDSAVDTAPELTGEPFAADFEQPGGPTIDYAAMLEAERQEKAVLARQLAEREQREAAWERQRQQMAFAQAQAAWKAKEDSLLQQTRDYDPEQRIQVMQAFYNEQLQQAIQAGQQAVQMVSTHSFADQVMREHGLTAEDRILLGNDPRQMQAIAGRIKAERDQHSRLVAQIERDRRARTAQQTLESGVNRIGGVNGRPVTVQGDYEKGSMDHLRALMGR